MSLLRKSSVPAHLRNSELADALPDAELRQLDQTATLVDVAEGREIIRQADPGRECFVIVDGTFAVNGPNVTATLAGGDVAGELALLTGERRSASVVATSDATVYVMHPREFETLLHEAPHFCRRVVASANGRLEPLSATLPARFAPKGHRPTSTRPWSSHLAELPSWQPTGCSPRSWSAHLAELPAWSSTI